jgi:hypothetical protein
MNLQEVISLWLLQWNASALLRRRFENCKVSLKILVQFQDGCNISAAIAIVWR